MLTPQAGWTKVLVEILTTHLGRSVVPCPELIHNILTDLESCLEGGNFEARPRRPMTTAICPYNVG